MSAKGKPDCKFFSACYGTGGLSANWKIDVSKAIVKEGKRKRYCRTCLQIMLDALKRDTIKKFTEAGLR